MRLRDATQLPALAAAKLVTPGVSIERELGWVQVVDHPDFLPWLQPNYLLLTTGYNWPQDARQGERLIREIAARGVTAVILAVPNFLEHFPEPALEEAERCDLPLFEIPWNVPFSQVSQEILGAIFSEQARMLQQSEDIHRLLTRTALESDSLAQLEGALRQLLASDVHFYNVEGGSLTTSDHQLPALARSTVRKVRQAHTLDGVYDPALGWLFPISLRAEIVGILRVLSEVTPLPELHRRAVEHGATVAALWISKQRELNLIEARLGYSFVDTLLGGGFVVNAANLERANALGFRVDLAYKLSSLVLPEALPLSRQGFLNREHWLERLRRTLQREKLPVLISVMQNQLLVLSAEGSPPNLLSDLLQPDVRLLESRYHRGVEGLQRAVREVQQLAGLARQGGVVVRYDDILVERVLSGDDDAHEALLADTFGRLDGVRSGANLMATVRALCEHDFSLKDTATRLGVHISTLRHRLERLEHLTGWSLNDSELRLRLRLAVQLEKLRAVSYLK